MRTLDDHEELVRSRLQPDPFPPKRSMEELKSYCTSRFGPNVDQDWLLEYRNGPSVSASASSSIERFVTALGLPRIHPWCAQTASLLLSMDLQSYYAADPPSSSSTTEMEACRLSAWLEEMVTRSYQVLPRYWAFAQLWIRLLSGWMAPIGILWLLFRDDLLRDGLIRQQRQREGEAARRQRNSKHLIIAGGVETIVPFVTVGMSWIVMTDQMYRYEYGPHNLFFLFGFSWILASRASQRRRSKAMERTLRVMGIAAVLWTTSLPSLRKFQHVGIFDENEPVQIQPGLYYNVNNPLIRRAVERYWPQGKRTYERPTPWMITGDARTGLPYFLNTVRDLDWKRVYLTVHDSSTRERKDEVVLELAVAFPGEGHDASKPLYLVLHGVNGGTTDGYIRDFVTRRNAAGSTVVVMEARGFMGTPLHSDSLFHGGRWSDVHATAKALRKALGRCQVLAGVGYSMGAIILSNYVARSGPACALDAAAAISGALDCRMEQNYTRSQRMWQPMIADHLRSHYYARFLRRLSSRLSPSEMTGFWRATNVVGIDEYASARYNGYADLEHFYADMGAMGDVRLSQLHLPDVCNIIPRPKICTMATPLVVLHSFDDPISTWRTVAANQGIMHPRNLVRAAENLVLLLTEKGGHVGWPVGMVSFQKQWEFMNEVASSFVEAVVRAKLDGGEEVAFRDEMNVKTCNASRLLGDNHCLFGG